MKTKERIKTLLLLVLLLGAGFLTYSIWFYDSTGADGLLSGWISGGDYEYNNETLTELMLEESAEEVVPFVISYHNERGRFGAAYHAESVNRLYQKTLAILREALSTVSGSERVSEAAWHAALRGDGILYDFEGSVPLAALAMQVGAENAGRLGASGRYLLFAGDCFYFKDPASGAILRLPHALGDTELHRVMNGMSAAQCTLALEREGRKVVAETPIFDEAISAYTVNGFNSAAFFDEAQMSSLLKIFGMNYNTCGKYTEKDGTQVFIEELNVLKIAPDGYVTYTSEEESGGVPIASMGDAPAQDEVLSAACGMIARLSYLAGGNGATYMQSMTAQGSTGWTLRFGWSFGGIPIDRQKTGYSAEIMVTGRNMTSIGFYMRSFENAGGVVSLVPQKLAAQAVDGTAAALGLRYTDGGGANLTPQWYVKVQ